MADSWTVTPVLTGLQQPRGVAFDGEGALYVSEAGLPGPGSFGITTGAVSKYELGGGAAPLWHTTFPAAYLSEGGGPPDVLGPSGITATGGGCTAQSAGNRNGCQVLMIMGLNSHEVPVPQIGHLFRLDSADGSASDRADIGDQMYSWASAHSSLWQEFPDSNPYGVLVTHGGSANSGNTFVVDAGANTVSRVAADGTATVIAYIPNETPVAGLPLRDATPTCAAQGPDGALYIGTLDLARNFVDPHQGWSHVYRVDPNSGENYLTAAHLWASGLTAVTACTFDSDGNFWATEMFKFNAGGPPGDVVRIPFSNPAALQHVGGGQLPLPGGIAQGPDGAMYVSVMSAGTTVANGAIMKVARA
ncbi:MAG TPA: ScyD/ScyE family protein [Candidatus Dormibacteraeota bacterium]